MDCFGFRGELLDVVIVLSLFKMNVARSPRSESDETLSNTELGISWIVSHRYVHTSFKTM